MKKFYFLFLFALIASISNLYAAEKTVTYEFTSKTWEAAEGNWTSIVPADAKYKAGPCASNPKNHPSAESPITYTNIKKIDVAWKTTSITGTIDVYVGSEKITTISCEKNKNLTTPISLTTTKSGKVKFVMTTTGANLYLKSIAITYEEVAETKCATPTFNLTADATYTDAQDLVITSTTEGAQIEYKIEGDKLTAPITGKQASPSTVHLTANGTYMVTATATKEGLDASESADLMFTIAKKMNKPTFNLTEGAVYGEAKVLEITSDKVGAQIEYTVFGGGNISITKTEASPVSVTLDQNGEYTVEAFALGMDDYAKSDAAGLNFKIELAAGVPTFSVEEGTYTEAQAIKLTAGEGGEVVYYTINDGPEQQYIDEPIKLEEDGTYKISAYTAATETLGKSATVTKTYVINFPLEVPYILCQNAAWLTEGTKIIFVGKNATTGGAFGMAAQNGTKYREQDIVTLSGDEKSLISKGDKVRVFTVEKSGNDIAFKDIEGYLSADNTKNSIQTKKTIGSDSYWTVSVAADGVATVASKTATTYKCIMYNAGNTPRFSAYKADFDGAVYIYLLGSTSSVSSMSAEGVKVVAAEGGVKVVADEATDVAVYTAAGQLVCQARVAEGSTLVNVAPGFYVVRANGTATKVIVR